LVTLVVKRTLPVDLHFDPSDYRQGVHMWVLNQLVP
jgi:hypothetical protein